MNRRYLASLVIAPILALALVSCLPSTEERTENWYSSATWSPEGNQVAYFKTHVEFVRTKPRVSIFIGEDTVRNEYREAQLSLCVNDETGMSERTLDIIEPPTAKQGAEANTNIEWAQGAIRYGAGTPGAFSTGVLEISPNGSGKRLIEPGYDPITELKLRPLNADDQELYSGFGDYGFFGHQSIFIFDHRLRQSGVYVHDPLSTGKPFVPPYDVTGR